MVGTSGIVWRIGAQKKLVCIMLYVDGNWELYEQLKTHNDEIARAMGGELLWGKANKDGKAVLVFPGADPADRGRWQEYFAWFMEKALRLRAAVLECVK